MADEKTNGIPSSEGLIDLSALALDTTDDSDDNSAIKQDLEDALAGKTEIDDPLELAKVEEKATEEEPEITPPPVEEVKPPKNNNTETLAILKSILGDEVTTIIQQNEEGEDVEVALEDLELTPDIVTEIISAKHQMDLEDAQKNSISTKGVSELGKSLIEIDKNGGNISDLLTVKQAFIDPVQKLDLDTVEGQKEAIRLNLQWDNTSNENIDFLLSAFETKGVLEEKANVAANELKGRYDKIVEKERLASQELANKRESILKDYKKELKDSLNSTFELKPALQEKLITYATKSNEDGLYEIDELYSQWRNDPKKTALLAMFLADVDEYNNQISSKKRQADRLDTASKIGVIKLGKSTKNKEKGAPSGRGGSGLIDLAELQ